MHQIVRIYVSYLYESCERHNYHVMLENDEGFDFTSTGYKTGSVYNNFEGLTKEEARERALIDAADIGDFLGITPDPFVQDGETHEPTFKFERYTTRRELGERRKAKKAG